VEPEVKAAGFNSFLQLARNQAGEARFESMVAGMPPDLADYVRRPRLATLWLPMRDALAVQHHVWRELLDNDPQRIFELARSQLIADMSTLYRFFLRFGSPNLVARRAGAIYGTFTRNAGRMVLVRDEERLVEIELVEHPFPSPELWHGTRGSIHGTADATRAHDAKTIVVAGGGADNFCRVRLTWA
jgi:hypothetical protein